MAERADHVELSVDGRVHRGWTECRVETGLDSLAHSFSLSATERWPGQSERWILEAGAEAKISIDGEALITGWIDAIEPSLSADDHGIAISGRSRAADLIDCSAIASPGSWSNRKLEDIASELAAPFGVTVTATASTGAAFKRFAIQPGESVFECIERMTKMRGLLIISKPDGGIELINPVRAAAGVKIEQGRHFTAISGRHDVSERFSDYTVKGQAQGDDDHNGKAVSQVKASATDVGVKRHRPLLVIADDQATPDNLKARARWEATVRAAKAQSVTLTMPGWRDPNGALWRPNSHIELYAPSVFVEAKMLVAGVAFVLNESGSEAELTLAYPQAYAPEPVPDEAQASRIGKKGKGQSAAARKTGAGT